MSLAERRHNTDVTLTLRNTYSPQDLETIVAIENECFPEGKRYSVELLRYLFESSDSIFFIAQHDATIVGFILADMKNAPEGYISTLDVTENFRKKRVASKLLSAAESALTERHCKRIVLEVAVDNNVAIGLYEKAGYAKVGKKPKFYSDQTDAFVLEKSRDGRHTSRVSPAPRRPSPRVRTAQGR